MVNGYAYIGTKDVNFDSSINYDNGIKIPFESQKFKIAHRNSILLCIEGGSAGRKIAYLDQDVCFGNKLSTITSFIVNSKYIYYLLQSTLLFNFFKINITGIIGGVSINKLKTFIIPLPPLKEQQRIIEKYENLLPYICRYNNIYEQLEKINNNYKEDLKKSILQYAIQGKLVKQDSHDEPADILINKILDEKRELIKSKKIKKENLSVIYKDSKDNQFYEKFDDGTINNITEEIPFDIPDSWCWTRLGIISTYALTKAKINVTKANPKTWLLDMEDIEKGGRIIKIKNVSETNALGNKTIFKKGDILYSKLRPYLKKILLAPNDGICTSELVPFTLYGTINSTYIINYLKSPYVDNKINQLTYGVKMPRVGTETMIKFLVPIPPLKEQTKITNKMNLIFNIL